MMELLNQAIAAHKSGDLSKAERLYGKCLRKDKRNHVAMQLVGLVYLAQGKLEQAIQSMNDSLRIEPRQAHVHFNIANCYYQQGQLEEAAKHYRVAIKYDADNVDAHQNLASALLGLHDFTAAIEVARKASVKWPRDAEFYNLAGMARKELGDFRGAIDDYQRALELKPDYTYARHNLGVAHRLDNHPKLALECYRRLLDTGMTNFELLQNVGNAHADLGELETAISYFRRVLDQNPMYVDAHRNLSALLWSMGDTEHFLASYEHAFAQGNINDALALAYIETLLSVDRVADAFDFLASQNVTDPQDPRYCDFFGRCHRAQGNLDDALRYHQRARELAPGHAPYLVNHAIALMVADQVPTAATLLQEVLTQDPGDQAAIAHYGLCHRLLDGDQARAYNDYDDLVRAYDLNPPPGYTDTEDFNRHLNDYLSGIHTSKYHPFQQTLRGGTQTQGNLFGRPDDVIQHLVNSLRLAISDYLDRLQQLGKPLHGFQDTVDFDFSASWSVRLKSEGYHTMHIHPMGRISSVYYVDLPDVIGRSDDMAGWLKFGEPNVQLPHELPPQHFVKPATGKLVLFPSYMWHGTIPFESKHPRTTVAFDIVPAHITGKKAAKSTR